MVLNQTKNISTIIHDGLFDKVSNELIYDSTRSNHFIYSENINAAYLNVKSEFKKLVRFDNAAASGAKPGMYCNCTFTDV